MRILGISCYYHDSAAALIDDGKIIATSAEERFSRKKHDSDFPAKAIKFCLKQGGIKIKDVDYIVFYEKPFHKFERITLSHLASVPNGRSTFVNAYKSWIKSKLWIKSHFIKELGVDSSKILFSHHHTSHAAVAYYTSGFKRSALLTVDGVGEWTTTAWGTAKDNKIALDAEIKFPHSLGLFYSTFTQFLGFRVNNGEFKVMGLSPYGTPRFKDKVEKLIDQKKDGAYKLDMSYFNFHLSDEVSYNDKFIKLFGVQPQNPKNNDKVTKIYADIAASVQRVLEEKLLVIAKNIRKETGETNLCYSGGVALNGVANWRIFKEAGFKNLWIHPAAGDAGASLGAALYAYHHVLNKPVKEKFTHVYFGRENTESEIENFITGKEIRKAKKLTDKDLVSQVTDMLIKGKVVAVVQNRFEWGPRALGARSILADPRGKKMKDIVNKKIKFREAFRPFAPVALYDTAYKYFEVPKRPPKILEYMLVVVQVREKWRDKLGATTHVNGSSRPQLVKKSINPFYYDIIKSFGNKTGIEVLLNTSFNLKGEPIVNTCEDAYKTFSKSGIDALVLGNYLIKK